MTRMASSDPSTGHTEWDELPLVLTVRQLAAILEIGLGAAYALCHQRGFPVVRVGRSFRVPREALQRWLLEKTHPEHETGSCP